MNLKLSEHQLRFRMSSRELQLLESDGTLSERILLPDGNSLTIAIERLASQHDAILEYSGDRVVLRLSDAEFAALHEAPAKEGISTNFKAGEHVLNCIVQVDLRHRKKR